MILLQKSAYGKELTLKNIIQKQLDGGQMDFNKVSAKWFIPLGCVPYPCDHFLYQPYFNIY